MLLRLLGAFLKLLCGYRFTVSGVGDDDLGHTECQACSLDSSGILSRRRFPNRVDLLGKSPPAASRSPRALTDCRSPSAVDLLGLLKWRSNTSLLQQNLRRLMKVDGGEVVKVTRAPGVRPFACPGLGLRGARHRPLSSRDLGTGRPLLELWPGSARKASGCSQASLRLWFLSPRVLAAASPAPAVKCESQQHLLQRVVVEGK